MKYIKYSLRRSRKKLKMIGWAATGFILLFCILTVQLSATEGNSPTQPPATKRLPSPAPVMFNAIDQHATSLEHAEKPTSSNSMIPVAPDYLVPARASQASHTFPTRSAGVDSVPPPSPAYFPSSTYSNNVYPNHTHTNHAQNLIPDPSTSPNAIYLQQPATGEVIYTEPQAMPRSNYFGVGPDDVCDEWSGFCNCKQKMFYRRGEACSDKDCRFKRGRNSEDCGCGN